MADHSREHSKQFTWGIRKVIPDGSSEIQEIIKIK